MKGAAAIFGRLGKEVAFKAPVDRGHLLLKERAPFRVGGASPAKWAPGIVFQKLEP